MSFNIAKTNAKRIVIVGGGFGGLKLANALRKTGMQVVLVDKNNFHQFPPLIYQVASSGIEPSSISFPFRKIFRKRKNFYFRMAEARSIFPDRKILQTSIGKIEYDYLVLAAGTTTNFFGNKHLEEQERNELQNIVIVGGGATGVEIAGVLSEMKKYVLPADYPDMDSSQLNIFLIEAAGRLLGGMSPESSAAAEQFLRNMGVNVCLHKKVTDYRDHKVIFEDGMEIPTRTFIWVSGVRAVGIGNMPSECIGRGGRLKVDAYNRVEGLQDVFAIGDQCIMTADKDYPNGHPQLAQVAIQQGKLLAANLKRMEKKKPLKPFRYKNLGSMATVGRNRAVAEFKKVKTQGWIAWVLWLVVHLRSILGVRNRVSVMLNWIYNYFTYDQSLRIIVYARKAKEVREREEREARVHWGEDLQDAEKKSGDNPIKK